MFTLLINTAKHPRKTGIFPVRRLHRLFLIGFLLVFPALSHGATYYIDSAEGDDANNGITVSTPWKTVAKVNVSKFQPDDFILFKRGCTWREQLTIPSSGGEDHPITFGAYGTGAKPVISGTDIVGVNGWTLYGGKIYVTDVSGVNTAPTQLYVDGEFYDIAHYPNSGYLTATENSRDTTSIIDSNLNLAQDQVVGATIMTRAVMWYISASVATAYNPSTKTITLNAPVYNSSIFMQAGYGFYLKNKLWMLDSPDEWYYDQATGKLYIWTSEGEYPGGNTVEVSTRSHGILVHAKNHITIRDIAVTGADVNNVYISGANKIIVKNLDISGGQNGIYIYKSSEAIIRDNSIRDTLTNGINAAWEQNNNIEIINNLINNTGNVGVTPKESRAGIYVFGASINVKDNSVTNSGYVGILFKGNNISVQNNVIDRACLTLDDCGGIYTHGRNTGDINKNISGNTVTNSIGNTSGTPIMSIRSHGIYLDDYAHDAIVDNNTISNASYGIFIHTGYNNTVTGNRVYGSRAYGFLINENVSGDLPGTVHDNIVTGNTFESTSSNPTVFFYSTIEDATNFGSYDRNHYCHPNSDFVVRNQNRNHDLPSWQQVSGQDLNSTDTGSLCTAPPPTVTLSASPATVSSGGSATLTWTSTNAISCTADGAWTGMKPVSSSLTIENITAGGTYNLTCTGRGGTATGSATITAGLMPGQEKPVNPADARRPGPLPISPCLNPDFCEKYNLRFCR